MGNRLPAMLSSLLLTGVLGGGLVPAALAQDEAEFLRGDFDADREITITDAVWVLEYLYRPSALVFMRARECADAADADDSGSIDITDAIYILRGLFLRGPPPPDPFPQCGPDPTADDLLCRSYPRCSPSFMGIDIDEEGVFYVIERSLFMQGNGELLIGKNEAILAILALERDLEFGVFFFASEVTRFPAGEEPAVATSGMKRAATDFIRFMPGDPSGACVRDALTAALAMARRSTAGEKVLFYFGSGAGVCREEEEAAYLRETLEEVTAMNAGKVTVHTVGVLHPTEIRRGFLQDLAARNGGTYLEPDWD